MKIMNYEIFTDDISTIDLESGYVINTLNAHSYVMSKRDKLFNKALNDSNFLIPDGSGIVLAAKHINKQKIKKVAGSDLHEFLLEISNKKNAKVFYMGSSQSTLDKIHRKIKNEYPNIIVESYSPPFKEKFSDADNYEIISKINEFNPDILFIGMTAPKQEKWLHINKNHLKFKTACSIGAVFDFYAGTVDRPNIFWINLIGEALSRFIKEPRRLWRRNIISIPLFLLDVFLYKFELKK